jgi:ethanolamine utilization protein EutJ
MRGHLNLEEYLSLADEVILHRDASAKAIPISIPADTKLKVGVDLGTAYLVLVVLDEDGIPLAGEWQFAQIARDGLVYDFIGAVDHLCGMKARIERRIGRELFHAASAYPPGVPVAEVRATANVLEAAGLTCTGLLDEPSAANNVLGIRDGAVVDVGGGTTGVAVIQKGKVVYTADEPTGGTHFSLVIAGALDMSFEDAEKLKTCNGEHSRLFPLVKPVMEKVASITKQHTGKFNPTSITLVGGTCAFKGMDQVVHDFTGIPVNIPTNPIFITPLGIALYDQASE